MLKETKERTPESIQMETLKRYKDEIEADITQIRQAIATLEEALEEKDEQKDMLDNLIAKQNEHIKEKEMKKKWNMND
jgi:rubrerythrin